MTAIMKKFATLKTTLVVTGQIIPIITSAAQDSSVMMARVIVIQIVTVMARFCVALTTVVMAQQALTVVLVSPNSSILNDQGFIGSRR